MPYRKGIIKGNDRGFCDEYKEKRYASPPLLKRMVSLGYFGRKSGKGFYDYSGAEPVAMKLV